VNSGEADDSSYFESGTMPIHRKLKSPEDREEMMTLRYRAYGAENHVNQNSQRNDRQECGVGFRY